MQRRFPFTQAESFHNRVISRHANLQLFCGPEPALINVLWGEEIKHPTADTKIDSLDRPKSPSFNENKLSLVDFAWSVTRWINVRLSRRLKGSPLLEWYPYFDKGGRWPFLPLTVKQSAVCLSQCGPGNSLLLCLCWKVKGGSCCDMKGLRVCTPLWSSYTEPCNWWHFGEVWGWRLPRSWHSKCGERWLFLLKPPHCTTSRCVWSLRPCPHKASVKSESDMWKH